MMLTNLYLVAAALLVASVYSGPVENEKPELQCGPNEHFLRCRIEECYTKCEHLVKPPACPSIAPGCNLPGCICNKDMLRDADGKCVNEKECPEWKLVPHY